MIDFPRPKKYSATVEKKTFLGRSEKFLSVCLSIRDPEFSFIAGQYVSVKISGEGERRAYSIGNIPNEHGMIDLVSDVTPEGHGTEFLRVVNPGDAVEILAPLGRFVMTEKGEPHTIFIATGSGIVPLKSMIEDALINRGEKRSICLYWGLRSEADIFWLDEFSRLQKSFPNFNFQLCISQPEEGGFPARRVTDVIAESYDRLSGAEAYICGNRGMIEQMKDLLRSKGLDDSKLFQEQFY